MPYHLTRVFHWSSKQIATVDYDVAFSTEASEPQHSKLRLPSSEKNI